MLSTRLRVSIGVTLGFAGIFAVVSCTNTASSTTSYSVTYNGNGNTRGTVPVDNARYVTGQTVTVLGNSGNLTLDFRRVDGWTGAIGDIAAWLMPGSTFPMASTDVTLSALWKHNWVALGSGLNGRIKALARDPSGNVYAGGEFTATVSGLSVAHVAKWDGNSWSALGAGLDAVINALTVDASGWLYAAGELKNSAGYPYIAKWNGSSWSDIMSGSGLSFGPGGGKEGTIYALAFDVHGVLYSGGSYSQDGVLSSYAIERCYVTSWAKLGCGILGTVRSIAIDGAGNLYAGGDFGLAGDFTSLHGIAKWDGFSWSSLGSGLANTKSRYSNCQESTHSIVLDAAGNLYAGGIFDTAGGICANYIARWDGSSWSALGPGLDDMVNGIVIDPSGNLYIAGAFSHAGQEYSLGIARWDGSSWSCPGSTNGIGDALLLEPSGGMYFGGVFVSIGGTVVNSITRLAK
jgi:hypothetical protein